MQKLNCWEFMKCGRESGGAKAREMGVCRANIETRLNKINGGINAGRTCWIITGTLCDDEKQGTFAMKLSSCLECDFYKTVRLQEGDSCTSKENLIKIMRIRQQKC